MSMNVLGSAIFNCSISLVGSISKTKKSLTRDFLSHYACPLRESYLTWQSETDNVFIDRASAVL
jgi:hypothetical protein